MCMQIHVLHMSFSDRFIFFPIYRAFNQVHTQRLVSDFNHENRPQLFIQMELFKKHIGYITLQIR